MADDLHAECRVRLKGKEKKKRMCSRPGPAGRTGAWESVGDVEEKAGVVVVVVLIVLLVLAGPGSRC